MHEGVKRDNDLQRGQSLENNQHHLMIDGEPSITTFELANRPTSVHRLGDTKAGGNRLPTCFSRKSIDHKLVKHTSVKCFTAAIWPSGGKQSLPKPRRPRTSIGDNDSNLERHPRGCPY